eukprot:7391843-Prymnesium_polylepis.5
MGPRGLGHRPFVYHTTIQLRRKSRVSHCSSCSSVSARAPERWARGMFRSLEAGACGRWPLLGPPSASAPA